MSQIAFGLVCGFVVNLQAKVRTPQFQELPFAVRAGLKLPNGSPHDGNEAKPAVRDSVSFVHPSPLFASICRLVGSRCEAMPRQSQRANPRSWRPNKSSISQRSISRTVPPVTGTRTKHGAAISLANPDYLAIVTTLDNHPARHGQRHPRTAMPAFAQRAGGMLTDQQIAYPPRA